jgi:hypothetical protein
MRGFLASTLNGEGEAAVGLYSNAEVAVVLYSSALEVLKWGTARWNDVPNEEKGAIFEPWFARGIKRLRLGTHLRVSLAASSQQCTH